MAKSKLSRFVPKDTVGSFGYAIHIIDKGRLMDYKGPGGIYKDKLPDLNSARALACALLPRESKSRIVIIYNAGNEAGRLIHTNGMYLYTRTYAMGERSDSSSYAISPMTGKTIKKLGKYIRIEERR